ncbi:serine/threonine-protein kinase [Streptomyces sp. TLI_105]|uniref:serine/threonine-protein kinase n=1 Tax=Streptomyces sp. TLI_105 TaxID=1881019 RepID=UPI000B830B5F|nr:serine/threonine-protein kinase [Streptomyces sp. TLI_105]
MPLESGDPRQIGAFRLLGVLGSGGMGRVYLGAVPGKFAAVKRVLPVLAEDADFLSHFGHELDNLARLPAGANTRLLASDRTAKPPWFATEFIPGITLNEAVRLNGGPLSGGALWRLLREAAAGLRVVHGADMVHRDLKPSNVMLTGGGLSLIDFGVARAADQSRLTKTGMVIGTPAYMAPEQAVADRQLTGAADVFGLGSLLLYAANGRPPFGDGSGPDLLYRVVHGEPDFGRLTEGDPQLAELVRKCLAKDPADRPTADELVGLTEEHAAGAVWPAAVAERIAERAVFAAGAPTAEQLAELERADPTQDVATASLTPQAPKEPATGGPDPLAVTGQAASDPPRWRRNRFVMFAVPVVVATGTTLTVALGPYEIGRLGASPEPSPSAVASQPASVPSASGTGKPSARPSAKPSAKPSGKPPAGSTAAPPPPDASAGGGGGAGGTGTLPGGSASGGGGGSVTGGGSSTTTSSGGSGSGSGSGSGAGSGSSGGSTTQQPAPPPATTRPAPPPSGGSSPSGTYSIENASNGQCLAESDEGWATLVNTYECGSPPTNGGSLSYSWTYSPGANGTFRLISKKSGKCLQPSGSTVGLSPCNGSSLQSWKIGTSTSSGRTIKNMNDGMCLLTGPPFVMTYTCDATNRAYLWRNISAL